MGEREVDHFVEGRSARAGGLCLDACPHTGEAGSLWRSGWRAEDGAIAAASAQYQARKDARNARRREHAAKLRAESSDRATRSLAGLPDFGQPILVGHHSEKRHRAALDRSHAHMDKALALQSEAEHLEARAAASEANAAISSDDPDALGKLRAKVAELESERERIKAYNRKAKKAGEALVPAFKLTNLGAKVRAAKQRIAELEQASAAQTPTDHTRGAWSCTWDAADNRVRVYSPRPSGSDQAERTRMFRSQGFLWSRAAGAWQRQASPEAWSKAVAIVERMGGS
jgi:hypothetical protein